MTICHCGAIGEIENEYFTGNCQVRSYIGLNTLCGTQEQEIVIHCPCADWTFKSSALEKFYFLECDNCKRIMTIEEALNLVSIMGEALTTFGNRLLAAKEQRDFIH